MRLLLRFAFPILGGLQLFALLCAAMAGAEYFRGHAATLTVTTTADSGPGSLRAAIAAASDGDTIQFDAALNGQTITLTSGCSSREQSGSVLRIESRNGGRRRDDPKGCSEMTGLQGKPLDMSPNSIPGTDPVRPRVRNIAVNSLFG